VVTGSLKNNTYSANCVDQLLSTGSTGSTPDSTVVVVNSNADLLTNCCPEVNTVNTTSSGSSSDFVDFVDQFDPLVSEILVTELNNPPGVELCNEKSQDYIEVVNTVNTVNNQVKRIQNQVLTTSYNWSTQVNTVNKLIMPIMR
jgi:hypothetical protein